MKRLEGQTALITGANSGIDAAVAKAMAAGGARVGIDHMTEEKADYATGTTIFVDGGMLLYPGFRTGG
jgi:glucose 1-dehydrogenase